MLNFFTPHFFETPLSCSARIIPLVMGEVMSGTDASSLGMPSSFESVLLNCERVPGSFVHPWTRNAGAGAFRMIICHCCPKTQLDTSLRVSTMISSLFSATSPGLAGRFR